MLSRRTNKPYAESTVLRVYSNSPIIYWWPVWVYGFFCAIITINNPDADWIGISYLALIFITLFFTNVRTRGVVSLVFALTTVALGIGAHRVGWLSEMVTQWPFLEVSMSSGFYLFSSSILFLIWIFSVLVFNRFACWQFAPGQVSAEMRLGGLSRNYDVRNAIVRVSAEDFMLNNFFGLGILGFGIQDIHVRFGTKEEVTIKNVWRARHVERKIRYLLTTLSE